MKNKIRRTDSLAYATGSIIESFQTYYEKWNDTVSKLENLGPIIIEKINKALKEKNSLNKLKNGVVKHLSSLGSLFSMLDEIYADGHVLMMEIDGLDFPVKTAQEIIKHNKKEQFKTETIRTVVKNLSKTIIFFNENGGDTQLIQSSLSSFNEEFKEYKKIISKTRKLLEKLNNELNENHNKAKKYSDRF
ncbi:MAG: hypothetical protein ACTSRR_03795 [Candidatus Heimdallarchaeaceae archaeon]